MTELSRRSTLVLVAALALVMFFTRSQHWMQLAALPDASWAIFFLLGFYLRAWWPLAALTAAAVAIDFAVIQWGGVSDFCVSPAYWLLVPAYAALYAGGRLAARGFTAAPAALLRAAFIAVAAAFVAELLSSGGFYFLSGRFADADLAGFVPRLVKYFPPMLGTFALYLAIAAACHGALRLLKGVGSHAR